MNKDIEQPEEQFDFWEGLNQWNEAEILERSRLQGENLKARGPIDPDLGNSRLLGDPKPWPLRRKVIVYGWALIFLILLFGIGRCEHYYREQWLHKPFKPLDKDSEEYKQTQAEGLVQ